MLHIQQSRKGITAGKVAAYGCGGLLVITVLVVMLGYIFMDALGRRAYVTFVDATTSIGMEGLHVPDDVQAQIQLAIKEEFSDKILKEELEVEDSFAMFPELMDEPGVRVVAVTGFENHHVKNALPAEEQSEAEKTTSRFSQAMLDDKVSAETLKALSDLALEKTVDSNGEDQFALKEQLSEEEVRQCLKLMLDAANSAGVKDEHIEIDYEGEMRSAIRKAIAEGKAQNDASSDEVPPAVDKPSVGESNDAL